MTRARRLQLSSIAVIVMGVISLVRPGKAQARQLLPCDEPVPVTDCAHIPSSVYDLCAICEKPVGCQDFHAGSCFYAYCDYET